MVRTKSLILVVIVLFVVNALSADDAELTDNRFDKCFLVELEGRIRLRQPMVYLGMVGVMTRPDYYLSKEMAEEFKPLVSNIVRNGETGPGSFYTFKMPRLVEGQDKFVMVWLETKMRGVETDASILDGGTGKPLVRTFEVVSAKLIAAEPVTREWINQWERLDGALKEIVSASLTAPDQQKRKALGEAIEKGSLALNRIKELKVSQKFRAMVKQIEPEARVVGTFKEGRRQQWYEWLEKFADRLKIEPKTPLPGRCERRDVLELLAQSDSGTKFVSKLSQSCPTESIDHEMFWSNELKRQLCVWEVEELTKAQYKEYRDNVKAWLAEVRKDEKERSEQEKTEDVVEWGALLRPAGADEMAANLILKGAVVEKLLTTHEQVGLKADDIILDYEHVNDVVMWWNRFSDVWIRRLTNRLKQVGELRVMRGEDIITIDMKEKR